MPQVDTLLPSDPKSQMLEIIYDVLSNYQVSVAASDKFDELTTKGAVRLRQDKNSRSLEAIANTQILAEEVKSCADGVERTVDVCHIDSALIKFCPRLPFC